MIKPNYVCPNRIMRSDVPFIMCQKQLKKPFEQYKTLDDFKKILCGHIYFCNRLNRWENSEGARTCTLNR